MSTIRTVCLLLLVAVLPAIPATADEPADSLDRISRAWAIATYRTPSGGRLAALEAVAAEAAELTARYPDSPEALIWEGIIQSTLAGERGGIGAIRPAKLARTRFEQALAIDERAMDAAAHTSLGVLYYKVPGFPVGFGSDRKARAHLERALEIAPTAIDANFYFGEFLLEQGDEAEALRYLEKALGAPARPGREIADAGRREETAALIDRVRARLARRAR